ncbi:MAG: RluA family pseudouridine synthase [Chlamydiia bacterium]|nr:RluA family pseudouridine synthase [Chlamydiia bacterium]
MNERILYFDNHLLLINKPAGLLTQPNRLGHPSVEWLAKQWMKKEYAKPGEIFLEAVHRLDRPTSGLVLFARSRKALTRLGKQLRERKMNKKYFAIVANQAESGEIRSWLLKKDYKTEVVPKGTKGAKEAILKISVLKELNHYTLLQIDLKTGRYHQIRAQLSYLGIPIVGDQKYGSSLFLSDNQIALHHASLSFDHPITAKTLFFEAPLPAFFPFTLFYPS